MSVSPAALIASFRRLLQHPAVSYFVLILGILTAGLYATLTHDDFQIVKGSEMALLAVTRFIVLGQVIHFFRGLIILGAGVPLVMGLSSPQFYHSRTWRLEPFLETAGIGLIPGLGLLLIGWRGLVLHRRHLEQSSTPASVAGEGVCARWLPTVEWVCELSIWLMIATLMSGSWSDVGVISVTLGALALVFSLVVLVGAKTTLGRQEIGAGLLFAGVVTVIASIVIVATQGNRCTEAVLGVPPGIVLFIIGLIMRASPHDSTRVSNEQHQQVEM